MRAPASPLTVWAGPARFVFAPGRDVIVGYGPGCDIALERLGNATQSPPAPRADVVLRFTGTHWVAIDLSHHGIFLDGSRVSTVEIRDGLGIAIADPRHGPRLVFQIAPPPGPPGPPSSQRPAYPPPPRPLQSTPLPPIAPQPARPTDPNPRVPTQSATQRMPAAPPQSPAAPRPAQPDPAPPPVGPVPPLSPPAAPPVVPISPPVAPPEQPKGLGLIERMVTGKLRIQRPSFRTAEAHPTHRLPLRAGSRTSGVAAHRLGLIVDGREALSDISFTARPGTLTAVIGPSAARNSALLGLLAGAGELGSGRATVDGYDARAEPKSMRTRIGTVSRDDRLHPQLTVGQVLGYAAELRLPPETTAEQRDHVVGQILDELELTPHRDTRIRKLSPEVRRCAAMAIELITRPALLVVDEPGAGLDAAQQHHVMAMLRRQADIGCVVVAALSARASLTDLSMCDQVLVLTATGKTAFFGTPLQIESSMGTTDWSTVLSQVGTDPDGAHRAFRARPQASTSTAAAAEAPPPPPPELPRHRQLRLLARRQVRTILADRGYFAFLAILPFVLAALTLLIPGDSGLARPGPSSTNPHEAIEILAVFNIAAVIIGTALTVRAVVSEYRVFRREQEIGLSATAYLAAKIIVFGLAAALLTAVMFAIVVAVKGGPVHGAVLLRNATIGATIELYATVALTAIVSAVIGLALSALGRSAREVLPLLVPVILGSVLFNGSLVQLASRWGLQQISWLVPAQWGFAASAATADLRRVDTLAANAEMWTHYSGWWVFDMVMLAFFGLLAAGFALYRLRSPISKAAPSRPVTNNAEPGDLNG